MNMHMIVKMKRETCFFYQLGGLAIMMVVSAALLDATVASGRTVLGTRLNPSVRRIEAGTKDYHIVTNPDFRLHHGAIRLRGGGKTSPARLGGDVSEERTGGEKGSKNKKSKDKKSKEGGDEPEKKKKKKRGEDGKHIIFGKAGSTKNSAEEDGDKREKAVKVERKDVTQNAGAGKKRGREGEKVRGGRADVLEAEVHTGRDKKVSEREERERKRRRKAARVRGEEDDTESEGVGVQEDEEDETESDGSEEEGGSKEKDTDRGKGLMGRMWEKAKKLAGVSKEKRGGGGGEETMKETDSGEDEEEEDEQRGGEEEDEESGEVEEDEEGTGKKIGSMSVSTLPPLNRSKYHLKLLSQLCISVV